MRPVSTLNDRRPGLFDGIDRTMAGLAAGRVLGMPAPIAVLVAFFGVNLATCLLLEGTIFFDDREQLAHMQSWAWGYKANQPPLHTWFVKIIDLLVGDDRTAVVAARYLLLLGTTWLLYNAGRLARLSDAAAAAGAMGCLLLPQFAFEGLRTLSHSLTLIFGIALTLNAVLLIARNGRPVGYALLAIGVVVAVLGKYNAVFALVAICLGVVSVPDFRRRFRPVGLILAALLVLALLAAPLLWLVDNAAEARQGFDLMKMEAAPSFLGARIAGTLSFTKASLLYSIVLVVTVAVCLAIAGARGLLLPLRSAPPASPEERFLRNTVLALLATAYFLVVVSGTTFVKAPWMHPLVIAPLAIAPALSRYARNDVVNGGLLFAALVAGAAATAGVLLSKLHETGLF